MDFTSAADFPHKDQVGFWGAFSHWVDFQLLQAVADGLPDVQLRLAGRVHPASQAQLDALVERPNVHFFGEMEYSRLPEFLKPVAVGLVPFQQKQLALSASPLKIYEAWAAGAGVVSAPLDESLLHQEQGVLEVASSPEEFVGAVRAMLRARKPDRLAAKAAENSWDSRFQMILDALAEVF